MNSRHPISSREMHVRRGGVRITQHRSQPPRSSPFGHPFVIGAVLRFVDPFLQPPLSVPLVLPMLSSQLATRRFEANLKFAGVGRSRSRTPALDRGRRRKTLNIRTRLQIDKAVAAVVSRGDLGTVLVVDSIALTMFSMMILLSPAKVRRPVRPGHTTQREYCAWQAEWRCRAGTDEVLGGRAGGCEGRA